MDISYVLPSISLAKLFHSYGLLDQMINMGFDRADEEYLFMFYELLELTADAVWCGYDDNYEVNTWYFSNRSMQEYYRLCQEYSKKHGIKLKENPYMKEAERYVDTCMNFNTCGYAYWLNTKINHEWASGIVLRTDCYFNGEHDLLEALLEIREWYECAVKRLKEELYPKNGLLLLPQIHEYKEVKAA